MLGFALCGSFCNFESVLGIIADLKNEFGDVLPIFSDNARNTDTRFFKADDFYDKVKRITGHNPLCSIAEAEPIGPKKLIDMLVVCPCTGNTLSKLACGITDTSVTMAVKSHMRTGGKTVIALSTNDALNGSFVSLAKMMTRKNVFFVPMYQDDTDKKPYSLVFDKAAVIHTVKEAYLNKQIQPIFRSRPTEP